MKNKSLKVIWAPQAALDLEEIIIYIAEESPQNAKRIFSRLKEKAENLKTHPNKGLVVPELKNFGITTYLQVSSKPWRIIYRINDNIVNVVAVVDSRQDLQQILANKLTR
jgi:toxin ParE1/3/4